MEAEAILVLVEKYGPQALDLVTFLIAKAENKQKVTGVEWASQIESLKRTASDEMTDRLKSAGIDLNSKEAVALLAATK